MQILDHLANQSIRIDLDKGVKVNCAKFQGVKLLTDSSFKSEKDLPCPPSEDIVTAYSPSNRKNQ